MQHLILVVAMAVVALVSYYATSPGPRRFRRLLLAVFCVGPMIPAIAVTAILVWQTGVAASNSPEAAVAGEQVWEIGAKLLYLIPLSLAAATGAIAGLIATIADRRKRANPSSP